MQNYLAYYRSLESACKTSKGSMAVSATALSSILLVIVENYFYGFLRGNLQNPLSRSRSYKLKYTYFFKIWPKVR